MNNIKKKIFIDFDGVISNTIAIICYLYNEDFCYYEDYRPIHWTEIESWGFDELNCTNREHINTYFNSPRFFHSIKLIEHVKYALYKISKEYDITIVSMGNAPNLRLKEEWIGVNFPFCKFIGCDFNNYSNKSHIDMSDAILIDDSMNNLITSNAKIKICFGDVYEWNKEWDGLSCYNWYDVLRLLKLEE